MIGLRLPHYTIVQRYVGQLTFSSYSRCRNRGTFPPGKDESQNARKSQEEDVWKIHSTPTTRKGDVDNIES